MVDKNLFLHDLAVVAILKNEALYLKEWLDYHLLAGVDHFYLYDNDSTDNQSEIVRPYIEAGLVDYFSAPGKAMQVVAYNDAVKNFKFHCRYMAFIDADEFIFPKNNRSIAEVVDEILSLNVNIAGMSIHWQFFGSNGHETADYSRGVLERFTRRAPSDDKLNRFIKTIADPRKIKCMPTMHFADFFVPFYSVDENLNFIPENVVEPIAAKKMVVNHYYNKSREEYIHTKMTRGWACGTINPYDEEQFKIHDRNEVFDNGILRYRAERAKNFSLPSKTHRINRVTETLTQILSACSAGEKFSLETALTCRELSNYLGLKVHEEASVAAILNSLDDLRLSDAHMFIRELPKLFRLPYPMAKYLREVAFQIISQFTDLARLSTAWQYYVELSYLQDFLKE